MSFQSDLNKFADVCEKNATKRLRRIGLVALRKIVMRTPVRTGCARSNWNVAINKEDTSFDPQAVGKSGGRSISMGTPVVMGATLGTEVNMVNTCPYIVSLERGHSRQRPEGFLKMCQAEIQNLIDRGAM